VSNLNPFRLAADLDRLSALLEERTEELAKLSRDAAEAEYLHKLRRSEHIVKASDEAGNGTLGKTTVDQREAIAYIATAAEYRERLLSAAVRDSTAEALRSIRAQLSSIQTASRFVIVAEGATR
jgi:hypothetical protein